MASERSTPRQPAEVRREEASAVTAPDRKDPRTTRSTD